MARQPESRLQRRIQDAIRGVFPLAYVRKIHVSEFQSGGIADLICCINGFFIAVEVKVDGGLPSRLQINEAKEVKRAGGLSIIAHSVDEAVEQIVDHLKSKVR